MEQHLIEGDSLDRRVMPELDSDGVRHWDNHGGFDAAPATDSETRILDIVEDMLAEVLVRWANKLSDDIQAALDKRDREIRMLRDEIALERGLAKLRTEMDKARADVAETRRLQPNFDGKLNVLQGQVEKLSKQVLRLRAGHSTLDFQQRENSKRMTLSRFEMASIGAQTREVLQQMRASGFNLMDEMRSPSELVS
jgi:chromosome segregation ATPase